MGMNSGRREKWDRRMLDLATLVASWSKDPSTKVGAVIAVDNRVISVGYNGLPSQMLDTKLDDRESKYSRTIHAEMNALMNMQDLRRARGGTLYVTPLITCDRCAVHLIASGISRVVVGTGQVDGKSGNPTWEQWLEQGELSAQYFAQAGIELTHYSI